MALKAFELRQKRAGIIKKARDLYDAAGTEGFNEERQKAFDGFMAEANAPALIQEIDRISGLERLETELREAPNRGHNPLPFEVETRHEYSVLKAMRQQLASREGKGHLDGIEAETHQEMEKRRARPAEGVLIPYGLKARVKGMELRTDLNTTTGVGSIATILDATMIDILRAQLVTQGAGATVMEGMQGLFAIPRQSGTGTSFWVAEGTAITASNQTIDQVAFTPKTVGGFTNYTRRFLEQTNQDPEQFARNDLMAICARGLETAAFIGTGPSNNQPTGLTQNTTIQAQNTAAGLSSGTNGGVLTWNNLVLLEQTPGVANADIGKLAYITDKAVRGHMKRTLKVAASTFPIYLWDGGTTPVNETACPVTNLLPNNLTKGSGTALHAMIYGNWADLVYALWSGMDIVVDPYTGATAGSVKVVVLQDADVNVRHPESFSFLADINPT